MVRAAAEAGIPVLGVCLGHQAIAEAFGAVVVRAPELLHGKTSEVVHEGAGVLAGLPVAVHRHPLPLARRRPGHRAGRARGHRRARRPGVVMALRHRELPIEGVQFHPESVLTEGGHQLLATWLAVCGLAPDPAAVEAAARPPAAAGGTVATGTASTRLQRSSGPALGRSRSRCVAGVGPPLGWSAGPASAVRGGGLRVRRLG